MEDGTDEKMVCWFCDSLSIDRRQFWGLLMMTASLGAGEAAASAQSCSDVQNESANPSDDKDTTSTNAKSIFDHLTKANGFSGAGAAGAVAVAERIWV